MAKFSRGLRLLTLIPLAIACIATAALGQSSPTIPVKVEQAGGFGRLIFDWTASAPGQTVPGHTVTVENNVLVVRFDRRFQVDLDALLEATESFVALARQDPDGRTLRLALKLPLDAASNVSGPHVAVDLIPVGFSGERTAYQMPRPANALEPIVITAQKIEGPSLEDLEREAARAKPVPADAERLPVRVVRNDGRSRVIFQWPERVGYDVVREDNTLVLSFNQLAKPRLARLRIDPPSFIQTAEAFQRHGGLEVRIDVDKGTDFLHFRQDDDIVLDIYQMKEQGEAGIAEAVPPSGETVDQTATLASAEAKDPVPEVDLPEPAEVEPVQSSEVAMTESGEVSDEITTRDGIAESKPHPVTQVSMLTSGVADNSSGFSHSIETVVSVGLTDTNEGIEIEFPWGRDVAASIFRRGDYLWAIFDAKAKLDLGDFKRSHYFEINGIEEMDLDEGTFVRIELSPKTLVTVRPEHHAWRILLGETAFGETKALDLSTGKSADGEAQVVVDLPSVNAIHRISDPEIGDEVFVVTALGPSQGVIAARKFVDFFAVASAHGLAVQPIAEDLEVSMSDGHVIVSKPGGLSVTGSKPKKKLELVASNETASDPEPKSGTGPIGLKRFGAANAGTMRFAEWQGDEELGFYGNLSRLNQDLAAVPSRAKSAHRLDLARFYFAHGLLSEALGALEIISVEDPAFTNVAAYVALKGATQERMGRHDEALKTLTHFSVKEDDGASMWKGLALEHLGQHKKARDSLADGMRVIEDYPLEWQARFQLVETQAALGVNDLADASVMWDNIKMSSLDDKGRAEAFLTKGLILDKTGEAALALEYYRKVYPLTDGEMSYRAQFFETEMLHRVGELSAEETIDRLERLRYQWRGDDLELRAIQTLGEIYLGQNRYRDALSVMRVGVTINPQHKVSRHMRDRMDVIFQDLYLGGKADTMKPTEAISLYYDFSELTPIGTKGDQMIRLLSERLVSIGLLDQAAELLDHQVKYRLKGTARAQVAMRLALIQLRNKNPEDAFRAISSTRFAGLPPKLRGQRRLIEARSLADMGRHEHAIELLEDDLSKQAQVLKAQIYWDADNWPETGRAYEALLDEAWGNSEPLTNKQRSDVMRMAIAYALVDDRAALDRVRQKFGNQMAKSPDARPFTIATGDMTVQGVAFRDVLRRVNSIDTFEAFMSEFKSRYGDDGTMVQ